MNGLVASESPRILVVEDNAELCGMLVRLLDDSGYHVDLAGDGHTGLHQALTREYDVMLIDRGLPAIDGLELILRLRRRGLTTPVLILTAYSAVADRVAGLDAGAEDYLVKPFEVDELLARLRALLRRHLAAAEVLRLGAGEVDVTARVARLADGTEVELSGREAALLQALAARPTRVYSREELREQVFRRLSRRRSSTPMSTTCGASSAVARCAPSGGSATARAVCETAWPGRRRQETHLPHLPGDAHRPRVTGRSRRCRFLTRRPLRRSGRRARSGPACPARSAGSALPSPAAASAR